MAACAGSAIVALLAGVLVIFHLSNLYPVFAEAVIDVGAPWLTLFGKGPDGAIIVPLPSDSTVNMLVFVTNFAVMVALPEERVTVVEADPVSAKTAEPVVTDQLPKLYPAAADAEIVVALP